MKGKLIKLSDTHYIIVDDSEIKEGDWVFNYFNNTIYNIVKSNSNRQILAISSNLILDDIKSFPNQYKKITHSTQPDKGMESVTFISLSEVEETIYGYFVEDMAESKVETFLEKIKDISKRWFWKKGFKAGFKAHQELVKDKLFTVDDMKKAIKMARREFDEEGYTIVDVKHPSEIIQSLLPKTEWNVEFDEQGKIKLI